MFARKFRLLLRPRAGAALVLCMVGLPACRRTPSTLERLAAIRRLRDQHQTAPALQAYGRLFAAHPHALPRIRLEAARYAFRHHCFRQALVFLDDFPENSPYFLDAIRLRIRILALEHENDQVLEFLMHCWRRKLFPATTGPMLAELYSARGNVPQAVALYDDLARRFPARRGEWIRGKARAYARNGRTERARTLLSGYLQTHPGDVPARVALADLALKQGDRDAAERLLRQALRAAPEAPAVNVRLARILLQNGKKQQAAERFAKALAAPNPPYALLMPYVDLLAEKHDRQGLKTLAGKPGTGEAWNLFRIYAQARLLCLDKRKAEALAVLRRGLADVTSAALYPLVPGLAAELALRLGHADEGARFLALAQKAGLRPAESRALRVRLFFVQGDYARCAKEAEGLDRVSPSLARIISIAETRSGHPGRAMRLAALWFAKTHSPESVLLLAREFISSPPGPNWRETLEQLAANAGARANPKSDKILKTVLAAIARHDFAAAATGLAQLPVSTGEQRRTRILLQARLWLRAGQADQAATCLESLPPGHGKSAEELFCLGWCALLRNHTKQAKQLFEQAAQQSLDEPGSAVAGWFLGALEARNGNTEAALKWLRRSVPAIGSRRPRAWFDLARIEAVAERPKAAWQALQRYAAAVPNDPALYRLAARLVTPDTQADIAALMRQGLRRCPNDPGVAARALAVLWSAGRRSEVRRITQKLENRFRNSSIFQQWRITLALLDNDFTAARSWLDSLERNATNQERANVARIILAAKSGNPAKALTILTDPKRRLPRKNPGFLLFSAMVYSAAGQNRKARELCRRELDQHPDDALGWYYLGELEMNSGQAEAAVRHFRRALTFRPDYVPALNNLAWTLGITLNRPKEALHIADNAVATARNSPDVLDTRAAINMKLGRFEKALKDLQTALRLRPDDPLLLTRAAEAAARCDKAAAARKFAARARQALNKLPPPAVKLIEPRLARVSRETGNSHPRLRNGAKPAEK